MPRYFFVLWVVGLGLHVAFDVFSQDVFLYRQFEVESADGDEKVQFVFGVIVLIGLLFW